MLDSLADLASRIACFTRADTAAWIFDFTSADILDRDLPPPLPIDEDAVRRVVVVSTRTRSYVVFVVVELDDALTLPTAPVVFLALLAGLAPTCLPRAAGALAGALAFAVAFTFAIVTLSWVSDGEIAV
jgi:hypothetical protein